MGIANFHKWLQQNKFAEPISPSTHLTTKILAIDFHHVLHQCIQRCPCIEELRGRILEYLRRIFKLVTFEEIALFLDGCAPLAKTRELKKRRKRHRKKIKKEFLPSDILRPNSHALLLLELHLHNFFRENRIRYHFSSSTIQGEGEIKLVKWMKNPLRVNKRTILYGSDSDLLPIAASLSHDTRVILVNQGKQSLVKISRVISAFTVREDGELTKKERLHEFIAMCILLGNDYLPKIPGIGFTTLIEATKYRQGKCLIKEGKFNNQSLKYLMEQLTPTGTSNTTKRDAHLYLQGMNWCVRLYLDGVSTDDAYSYRIAPPWIHEMRKIL